MAFSGKSLNNATVTGPGAAILLSNSPKLNVGMMAVCSSMPTSVTVVLEGSIDGINWAALSSNQVLGTGGSGNLDVVIGVTSVAAVPVRYARTNILATDGTPCTAWVALDPKL